MRRMGFTASPYVNRIVTLLHLLHLGDVGGTNAHLKVHLNVSSGDEFNRRFQAILADFQKKERLIDDTLYYDDDLEEHWWRTEQLLSICAASGIVLNPDKFQFAQREVDFAGCRITEDRVDPLPKLFSAIQDFPTPTNATDIKSWFGLVNQVATYAQLQELMEAVARMACMRACGASMSTGVRISDIISS